MKLVEEREAKAAENTNCPLPAARTTVALCTSDQIVGNTEETLSRCTLAAISVRMVRNPFALAQRRWPRGNASPNQKICAPHARGCRRHRLPQPDGGKRQDTDTERRRWRKGVIERKHVCRTMLQA
jgi:hypothetical protein